MATPPPLREPAYEVTPTDVYSLLDELRQQKRHSDRNSIRNEIVAPVAIETMPGITISAQIRDQSPKGLGFVHRLPIPNREVVVHIGDLRRQQSVRLRISWCHQIDPDTFISGGHYVH